MNAKKEPEGKFNATENTFWLFYGAVVGILAGTLGNLWATLFFEYAIRGDTSLETKFWYTSIGFLFVIGAMSIWMISYYRKMSGK